jgi:DNA topoisomerase-1
VALNTIKPTNLLIISFIFDRCKKWEVPLEKVYNKTQREKFRWAIDMADEDFVF